MAERSGRPVSGSLQERRRSRELRARGLTALAVISFGCTAVGLLIALSRGPVPVASTGDLVRLDKSALLLEIGVFTAAFVPLLRPFLLLGRWLKIRDYTYAAVAAAVLAIIGLGLAIRMLG